MLSLKETSVNSPLETASALKAGAGRWTKAGIVVRLGSGVKGLGRVGGGSQAGVLVRSEKTEVKGVG